MTKNGLPVGLIRYAGREVVAKRFDTLPPREVTRAVGWAGDFIRAAGLFTRAEYDDLGFGVWGLEVVPYTEWTGQPPLVARRPGQTPKPPEPPKDMRHNPDLDAAFA